MLALSGSTAAQFCCMVQALVTTPSMFRICRCVARTTFNILGYVQKGWHQVVLRDIDLVEWPQAVVFEWLWFFHHGCGL